ncbi:MAG: hypothetical protein A4E73_02991 [Syntrophaceae bacterium PtaU1.Bin231]|nr:MAG: hypothetical protein A4E73_02991 [Syntrophaceae bacterium PtaU1.Bin231]
MRDLGTYIENRHIPQFWGWVLLILFSAALLSFGMWIMMAIPDTPRQWDFGTYPDTPAESPYSTLRPPRGPVPQPVIRPLPEAKPFDPAAEKLPANGSG